MGQEQKKNGKVIWLCRDCHDRVEQEITRKENEILQSHPEIYIGTLMEFLGERERPKSSLLDYLEMEEQNV